MALSFQDKIKPVQSTGSSELSFANKIKPIAPPEERVGGFQSFIRSMAEKPLSWVSSIREAGAQAIGIVDQLSGNKNESDMLQRDIERGKSEGYDYGYFGKVKPIDQAVDKNGVLSFQGVKNAVGTGAEVGALASGFGGGGSAAVTGIKGVSKQGFKEALKQTVKTEAKIGAVAGGSLSFGDAIQEAENSPMDVAYKTLFGTTVGGVTGAVAAPIAPLAGKAFQKAASYTKVPELQSKLADGLRKVFNPTARQIKSDTRFGGDSFKFIAEEIPDLPISVNSNGRIEAGDAIEMMKTKYAAEAAAYKPIIRNSGKYIDIDSAVKDMKSAAAKELDGTDLLKAEKQIDDEINAYLANNPTDINVTSNGKRFVTLSRADDIKSYSWSRGKGWGTPEAEVWNDTNNIIGHALKDAIERELPNAPIKAMNRRLGQWKNAIDMLERRNGLPTGQGGKLSKLFSRQTGSIIGATIGAGTSDNGITGGLGGAGTGFMTASLLASLMSNPNVRLYAVRQILNNLNKAGRRDMIQEAESMVQQQASKYLLPAAGKSSYVEKPIILPTSVRETNLGLDEVKGMNQSLSGNRLSSASPSGTVTNTVNNPTTKTTLSNKNIIPETVPQSKKTATKAVDKGVQEAAGGIAGFEMKKDENGKTVISFNKEKAIVGIIGMAAYKKIPKDVLNEAKIKMTDELKSLVAKTLSELDTIPVKTNKGLAFGDTNKQFRLSQLQDIVNRRDLTVNEAIEALPLLKTQGADLLKQSVEKVLPKYIKNPITGKMAGSTASKDLPLITEAKKYKSAEEFVRANESGVLYHGSPTGEFGGGAIHVGTKKSAQEALEARIGIPASGKGWDGTTAYGDTLLAGQKTLKKLDPKGYNRTGFNVDVPQNDFYLKDHPELVKATFGDGNKIPLNAKPSLFPVKIRGEMTNLPDRPLSDVKANATIAGQLKKGTAKRGYYYENIGEDAGSISAVVPSKTHLERGLTKSQLTDLWNKANRK